jgi:hypothetical protein
LGAAGKRSWERWSMEGVYNDRHQRREWVEDFTNGRDESLNHRGHRGEKLDSVVR